MSVLLGQLSYNVYGGRLNWPLVGTQVLENVGYRQLVWLAWMWAWFWRRPVRPGCGRPRAPPRPPGAFARLPTGTAGRRDHRSTGDHSRTCAARIID